MKRLIILFLFVFVISLASALPHGSFPSFASPESRLVVSDSSLSISDGIIFSTAYYSVDGDSWSPLSLSGFSHPSASSWLLNSASASLPLNTQYLVIYSCSLVQSGQVSQSALSDWDCHGRTSQEDGFWQLHVITTIESSVNSLQFNFDERSGSLLFDDVDSTSASIIGSLDLSSDEGVIFSGGYVDVGDVFSEAQIKFTLGAWVSNISSSNDYQGIIMHGGSNIDTFGLYVNPNAKDIGFKTTGTSNAWFSTPASSLFDSSWHYIVATYDGQKKSIYLDGVLLDSIPASGSISSGFGHRLLFGAGRESGDLLFFGVMDNPFLLNESLSAEEISERFSLENKQPSSICVPASGGEVCNGKDDDCDGVVDDGNLCSENEVCEGTLGCRQIIVSNPGSCDDSVKNGDEVGVDCGGSCAPCTVSTDSVCRDIPPDESLRILFIGNSFTGEGPIYDMVRDLATSAGFATPHSDYRVLYGRNLAYHRTDAGTLAKVDQGDWDFVVLQDHSRRGFEDLQGFKDDMLWFYDRIKESSPDARVVLYQTWMYYPESNSIVRWHYGGSIAAMQEAISSAYNAAAYEYVPMHSSSPVKTDIEVAPVGDTWLAHLLESNPLYLHKSEDDYHASDLGEYLNALVLFSTIYQSDVTGLDYLETDASGAQRLQTLVDAELDFTCVVATCDDSVKNGDEVGVDCGGSCPACSTNDPVGDDGEICNGLDDNGDGQFDEGVVCSSGYSCYGVAGCIEDEFPLGTDGDACPAGMTCYYISPTGSDSNDGSFSSPFYSLNKAWNYAGPDVLMYMRGGEYGYDDMQRLTDKDGTQDKTIKLWGFPGEKPIISPSSSFTDWTGVFVSGAHIHLKGIDISGYVQTPDHGFHSIYVGDAPNTILEEVDVYGNAFGLYAGGNTNGGIHLFDMGTLVILNSDFHHNQNPYGLPGSGSDPYGGADGVAARYFTDNSRVVFKGCRFWWNSDDGVDLFGAEGMVIIDDSWAFWNGYIPGTFTHVGDGNGYKLGFSQSNGGELKRIVQNSLAFQNEMWGFNSNDAVSDMKFSNNIAYDNCYLDGASWCGGFTFYKSNKDVYASYRIYANNNIAYNNFFGSLDKGIGYGTVYPKIDGVGPVSKEYSTHNSWDGTTWESPFTISDSDFISLDVSEATSSRNSDGSLPDIDLFKLKSSSDLIDAGVNVGLPYQGTAPDVGLLDS